MTGTLPKVDLNVDNFELWMTVILAVESADQIWWWIIVVMVHMHHSQPLKTKFGNNHFLGLATLGPKQYRKGVKLTKNLIKMKSVIIFHIFISKINTDTILAVIQCTCLYQKCGISKFESLRSTNILGNLVGTLRNSCCFINFFAHSRFHGGNTYSRLPNFNKFQPSRLGLRFELFLSLHIFKRILSL